MLGGASNHLFRLLISFALGVFEGMKGRVSSTIPLQPPPLIDWPLREGQEAMGALVIEHLLFPPHLVPSNNFKTHHRLRFAAIISYALLMFEGMVAVFVFFDNDVGYMGRVT